MNRLLHHLYILLFIAIGLPAQAQTVLTQNIRGIVTDAESKQPLTGVTAVLLSDNQRNDMTDSNGYFIIKNVPVGRQSFQFSLVGYEPRTVSEVLVTSGKELELNISLTESIHTLQEVSISANKNKTRPMNEFATVSARSFSVEETKRYAASVSDPARMAMNFMGVSSDDDAENGIVVRGNSPRGILWRLEGIEIPSPNHFSNLSTSGGAVSMLNASMLGTSDFYTGAFPPEIGNALSGAFDLNFRNGNTDRYEHAFQVGTLGAEIATEGPFRKGGKSSYIVNYRYSTLKILLPYFNLGGVLPEYQDASFKLNFPTAKAGTFSVWGLGGYNKASKDPEKDSTQWTDENPNFRLNGIGWLGVAGITHQYFITPQSYIKTILSYSYDLSTSDIDTLTPSDNYSAFPTQDSRLVNTAYRLSVMYNNKLNSRNTLRTGIVAQQLGYDLNQEVFDRSVNLRYVIMSGSGSTQYYQAYLQWKNRITQKLTAVAGIHGSFYALNNTYSIEPRASLSYTARKSTYTLAAGMHSKPEAIYTYLLTNNRQGTNVGYPNKNLDLLHAIHIVGGFETPLPFKSRLKIEVYYQYLYDIPVEKDSLSGFSILNAENIFSLVNIQPMVSTGTGKNYGIDMSLERPLNNGYYILLTGSLYRSLFTNYAGQEYNTMFNRSYQLNVLGGKEFKLNRTGKTLLGLNGKALYSGGLRESVIDLQASRARRAVIYENGKFFTLQGRPYSRIDASVYIKFNNKRATHSIQFDAQNVLNRQNYFYSFYDNSSGTLKTVNQTGIIPNIAYRVEFH